MTDNDRHITFRAAVTDARGKGDREQLQVLSSDKKPVRIHGQKFPPSHYEYLRKSHLMEATELDEEGTEWLLVDSDFADLYMSALAAILSEKERISSVTDMHSAHGVALKHLLDNTEHTSRKESPAALVSFVMESIKIDPDVKMERLLAFRRSRRDQFEELSAQFSELGSKMTNAETSDELKRQAGDVYSTKIRPKLQALKAELQDNSIQSLWEGMNRAATVTLPAGGALAYFENISSPTSLIAVGAFISVADVTIRTALSRRRIRRGSPYTYLLDVEKKFGLPAY